MLPQIVMALIGMLLLGAAMLALGLRGKRLNDHPICRDCGFDLVAIPDGCITCPECGAGLRRPKAIRTGQRRKRPLVISTGALLLILPLFPIGAMGYAVLSGQEINGWKPLGVLLWEAERSRGPAAQKVAAELHKRYISGQLDKDRKARIRTVALDTQADASRPWCAEWGNIIDQADTDGDLTKEDLSRFRKHAPVLEFKIRPSVRMGDPLPVVVKLKESRIAASSMYLSQLVLGEASIGGTKVKRSVQPRGLLAYSNPGNQVGWFYLYGAQNPWGAAWEMAESAFLLDLPKDIAPGRHTLNLTVHTQTKPQSNRIQWNMGSNRIPKGDDVKEHTAQISFTVLTADAEPIEKIASTPELQRTLELALSPSNTMMWEHQTAQQQFSLEGATTPVAYEVIWKSGDQEWSVGFLTTGSGASESTFMYGASQGKIRHIHGQITGFKGTTVDVVLRPSEFAAVRTIDQFKMYDGEIVMKGISVEQSGMGGGRGGGLGGLFRSLLGG